MDDFRRFFLRGLGALVPTLLTFALLIWCYNMVNDHVGVHITRGLLFFCSAVSAEPRPGLVDEVRDPLLYGAPIDEWNDQGERLTIEYKVIHHKALRDPNDVITARAIDARNRALWAVAFTKYRLHLLGFLIAIILVYFMGFFLASFIGRTSWRAMEGILARIPFIRAIYQNVKQVTDFLLSDRPTGFSGVVAVQYPRPGLWSVGFTTGGPLKQVEDAMKADMISVFLPCSPPFTGYTIQVSRAELMILNMTTDDALRFLISGGVIKPGAVLSEGKRGVV